MSEDKKTTQSTQPLPMRTERVKKAAVEQADKERLATINWIIKIGSIAVAIAVILDVISFFQTGARQMLATAIGEALAFSGLFLAHQLARRSKIDAAGYVLLLTVALVFGISELNKSGMTLYLTVGGLFMVFLVGSLVFPQHWTIWLTSAGLFAALIWLVNQLEPWPRFGIERISALNIGTPLLIAVVAGIFLWRVVRVYRHVQTIRTRLSIIFVLLVLLLVGGVSLAVVVVGSQSGRQQAVNQLESVAKIKEAELSDWVDNLQNDLESALSGNQVVPRLLVLLQAPEPSESQVFWVRNYLQQIAEQSARLDELFLMDLHGKVILSTDVAQDGNNYGDQPYFQKALMGFYAQPPTYSEAEGWVSMVAARPVVGPEGNVLGVVAGRVNPVTLAAIMGERAWLGNTGEGYLVDRNQIPLTPLRFGEQTSKPVRSEGVMISVSTQASGSGLFEDYRGVPVVGVYHWLPELEIALVAKQDQAEAFLTTNSMLMVVGYIALGAVAIAVVASLLVTRSIARPLTDLTEAARQVEQGNLDVQVPVATRDEVGQLAQTFNSMAGQLRNLIDSLEDRVHERTLALETSADISSQVIAIRAIDELLQYVVNRIQTEFDFYHTHIYLIEAETGDLVMVEGSGEMGRQLKEKGHRLEAGQGIVGTVASTNEAFLSNNVDDLLNFVRNPLLPDTKSELAVPLRKGNDVLGVLDIQSEQLNRFSQSELSLMQAIANQTAIAVDNARLLAETQAALREVERLNRQLTGEVWEQAIEQRPATGYRFIKGVSLPLTREADIWLPPMKQAAVKRQVVKEIHPGNGEPPRAELAVPLLLRGQVIGTLGLKREEAADWNEDELTAVESVANQITLALENARLSEEQAKTIVQLKDVDRLKSEFLTSMSHELRTPLNSIIGFADVILQGIDGDLPDLALNDVRLIYNSGHHLLALINDILDLAKIEAGKMELVREPVNVAQAIKEVLAASRSLLKDKPIDVVVEAAEDLPAIYADKLRFNQILLNLVSNATKFTEKGEIILAARVYDPEPDKMFVSVTDSGIGIASDKLGTIFDRFRQADSSTTRKYGGTGLGLPICKQLVEMHSGHIGVVSSEGKGSTFYFTIPLVQEAVVMEG